MQAFGRFSHRAKQVLTLAQEEAELAHHSYIGTEHLLLGLMRAKGSIAAVALESLGLEVEKVRHTIFRVLAGPMPKGGEIVPTSRVKRVIEIAFGESQREQQPYVGTGELLMALVIEGEGIAAHVLKDLGGDRDRIIAAVHAAVAAGASEGAAPPRAWSMASTPAGVRVLVHDPAPPYRLWEGRVVGSGPRSLEVEVPDRPAGTRMSVDPMHVHPIPTGPTLQCEFCMHHE